MLYLETERYHPRSKPTLVGDKPHDVDVVGEPAVVEFFEPRPAYKKIAGKPPDVLVAFQYRNADAALPECGCRGQTTESGAHHDDMRTPGGTSHDPATHRG